MQALFASKTFKGLSSASKAHVRAAINDPLNIELVTQLKSYLDDEYQTILALGEEEEAKAEVAEEVSEETGETEGATTKSSKPSGGHSAPPISSAPSKDFGDKVEDIEEDLGDMPKDDHLEVEETSEVEESTKVSTTPIEASTALFSLIDDVNEIKGALNLDATTSGVARVVIKEKELWIYYNDNVNLNNVMNATIDKLNAGGYTYLSFSRLARSDNAIVFDINIIDTDNVVEPVENEDEK